jgi:homoserine kinase
MLPPGETVADDQGQTKGDDELRKQVLDVKEVAHAADGTADRLSRVTVTASAPATTANLGPAYDCIALALQPRCVVTADPAEEWSVEHIGHHRPPDGAADFVLSAASRVSAHPLSLTVASEVPIGKGLGSSAAALVAGLAVGLGAAAGEVVPDRIFRLAAELEGHPEQVAAAVYGGLVLIPAEGMPVRLPLHPSLRPLIAVPESTLSTETARGVVEGWQQLDVVVRTLARVSALTAGLITGDRAFLGAAHGDEVHEAPRALLSPEVDVLLRIARSAGALHAARSGSGPAILALVTVEEEAHVKAALERAGAMVLDGPMDTTGLLISRQ